MGFERERFFSDLVEHLSARREAIRSLAVMSAMERWVQFEAAALLDFRRDRYGIGGGSALAPDWWVTCEHQTADIWLEGPGTGVAIELKALHNNKNFYAKAAELRNDLTPVLKRVPIHVGAVLRTGILVLTYARYARESESAFATLRSSRNGPFMLCDEFLRELSNALTDDHGWYGGSDRLRLLDLKEIASLDGARYIETGLGAAVWLGLAESMA
jgi:hypothetical protein